MPSSGIVFRGRGRWMPAASRCPIEIWMKILRYATCEAEPTEDNNFHRNDSFGDLFGGVDKSREMQERDWALDRIVSLMNVDRAFRDICRCFLYEDLYIVKPRYFDLLARILTATFVRGEGHIGRHVRRLWIDVSRRHLDAQETNVLCTILGACTNLVDFHCDGPTLSDWGDDLIPVLARACSRTLRFVYIQSGDSEHPYFAYTMFLEYFPGIREFHCACVNSGDEGQDIPEEDLPRQALQLQSLAVHRGTSDLTGLMDFFANLYMPNLRQVVVFNEGGMEDEELPAGQILPEFNAFFNRLGPQLRSVCIGEGFSEPDEDNGMGLAVLARCPNVRDFSFDLGVCSPDVLNLPALQSHRNLVRVFCSGFATYNSEEHFNKVWRVVQAVCRYPQLRLIRFTSLTWAFLRDPAFQPHRNLAQSIQLYCQRFNKHAEFDTVEAGMHQMLATYPMAVVHQ